MIDREALAAQAFGQHPNRAALLDAALAAIVPAVTAEVRKLHREQGLVIWRRDLLGDDHEDKISHCALCGDDWPCDEVDVLDQLEAEARGQR